MEPTRLLVPLLVGCVMMAAMVLVQAVATTAIIHLVRRQVPRHELFADWLHLVGVFASALLLIVAAQVIQVAAWAALFMRCGEFADFPDAFYHSAVNFTTLGYGDVVMSPAWKLLGPAEAAAGMLMFGVSTAVLFAATQALVRLHDSRGSDR
jgi:Ion channel